MSEGSRGEHLGDGAELPAWELEFRFEGGLLPLAFTATVGERWRRGFERLTTPQRWGQWLVAAGLVDIVPEVSEGDVVRARSLREAIYRSVRALMQDESLPKADLELINQWAARPPTAVRLAPSGELRMVAEPDQSDRCLAELARRSVHMLADADIMRRVRECAAPDCALLFYDASRPGRRRWCSDGACGTRNRARRRRSSAAPTAG